MHDVTTNDLAVMELVKEFAGFRAVDRLNFAVPPGSFFSILGPSGCGKTTLLRMIAGFEEPNSGTILIRGQNMAGVAPNRRPVNLVFQHLALFPMMNVAENIAFGLKRRKLGRNIIQKRTEEILERVGLPGYGGQAVQTLSGGQQQRVAIARCLVLDPSVLLLDEPLGALDLKLREQMKIELKKLQNRVGTTFIYITHDQSEALMMSDQVAVMHNGRFEQVGAPLELYREPQTPFVAGFVGDSNRWPVTLVGQQGEQASLETLAGVTFHACLHGRAPVGDAMTLFLRPEVIRLEPRESDGLNRFTARLKTLLFDGANSKLLVTTDDGLELQIALPQDRSWDHLQPGQRLNLGWHPQAGVCFPGSHP